MSLLRPVAPRARRIALMPASVPELTRRIICIDGSRCKMASASSNSRSVPPTALKARTGEFTPPGMSAFARSNSGIFRSVFGVMGWHHKAFQGLCIVNGGVVFFGVPGIVGAGRGPEHAVGKDMPHSGAKAGVQAPVEVAQRFAG